MVEKTRNNNQWTEARYRGFIRAFLRKASLRWGPKNEVKKAARVRKGVYICNRCKEEVTYTKLEGDKRIANVFVDHIIPVVDPVKGFTTWDEYIERLFCEADNLQVLCKDCHDEKSKEEKEIRNSAKRF